MPEINSPNQRRLLAEQQSQQQPKPLRQFTVGAPEPEVVQSSFTSTADRMSAPSEAETARKEARQARLEETVRISDPAKRRIEHLAGIGRLTRDVSIEGISFSLRTLKAYETREVSLKVFNPTYTNVEASYEARRQQLARSIFKIDSTDVALVLGDDSVETRLNFIDELEETAAQRLFDEFTVLKNEATAKFGITTDAEVKEVAEDLKK